MLPLLSAHPHRCRDCKHRYWVGVVWSRLVFGGLALMFVAGIITTVVLVRQSRVQSSQAPAPVRRLRRRRVQPLPKGLPPLSAVPRPKNGKAPDDDDPQ